MEIRFSNSSLSGNCVCGGTLKMLHLGPQPPPSGQEGWPRGRLFTSSWGSVRGLYWFAVREVASLAAPSLCVLALNAAQRQLRGLPLTLSSGRFAVVSILLLQLLVRGFASLLVLPAQREVLAWVEYLARAEWLPQAVRNALRGPRDALMERSLNVDRAKLALSERHRGRDADGAEPVRICAPDGTLLQAWWAPAPPAAGKAVRAVVYLCGNGESAEVGGGARRTAHAPFCAPSPFYFSSPTPPTPTHTCAGRPVPAAAGRRHGAPVARARL